MDDIVENLPISGSLEWLLPSAEFIHQTAQSPYVTLDVEATRIDSFRGEVVGRAHCALGEVFLAVHLLAESEVGEFD